MSFPEGIRVFLRNPEALVCIPLFLASIRALCFRMAFIKTIALAI
jgi:hypothetical protein